MNPVRNQEKMLDAQEILQYYSVWLSIAPLAPVALEDMSEHATIMGGRAERLTEEEEP